MPTIDKIKESFDEGFSIAKESVAYMAERAEDVSRIAAVRLRIFGLRRRIEQAHAELGAAVYARAAAKSDVWADAGVKKAVKDLAALEEKLNELFAKLDALAREAARRSGATRPPTAKAASPTPPPPPRRRRKTT